MVEEPKEKPGIKAIWEKRNSNVFDEANKAPVKYSPVKGAVSKIIPIWPPPAPTADDKAGDEQTEENYGDDFNLVADGADETDVSEPPTLTAAEEEAEIGDKMDE